MLLPVLLFLHLIIIVINAVVIQYFHQLDVHFRHLCFH